MKIKHKQKITDLTNIVAIMCVNTSSPAFEVGKHYPVVNKKVLSSCGNLFAIGDTLNMEFIMLDAHATVVLLDNVEALKTNHRKKIKDAIEITRESHEHWVLDTLDKIASSLSEQFKN